MFWRIKGLRFLLFAIVALTSASFCFLHIDHSYFLSSLCGFFFVYFSFSFICVSFGVLF
jgi:hypothetical protein